MDDVPEYDDVTPEDLISCNSCGRSFIPSTLVRHEKICQKSAAKRRKVFDSSKMRAEGTDINTVPKTKDKDLPPSKKNNWRRKHEDFIEAMQSAKGVSHAIKTGKPLPPPPSQKRVNPDYVQCPSCDRNFSESAADRHIPWCKEKNKRVGKGPPKSADRKSKLETRTKYKPPLPGSKKQSSPAARTPQSRVPQRSKVKDDMAELESRMNGSMRIGNKTSVRNKPYTGSKVRSASLERPSPKVATNSYRSNSGDSMRSKRDYNDYDDDLDYDLPDSRQGSAGRRLKPLNSNSSNHYLPHDRLKAVSDDGYALSPSRTPTPPSSRPSSNPRKTSADIVNGRKLPKFCHECGTRYPVTNAKYCCECGTRREFLH